MKSFVLAFALTAAQLAAVADDKSPAPSEPRVTGAATDSEEQEFHDPFAKQENASKAKPKAPDPLEKVNRAFFRFNDKLYFWVLKPVAKGYNTVAPEPFRSSMKRLFVNARYPVRVVNNLLQGKLKGVGMETARFLINSTVGIGGLFDPARDEWRLPPFPQDLDLTLGFYTLPTGAYIDWPLLGPSSVRGTVGMVGDGFLSPWSYIDGVPVTLGVPVYDTVNSVSLRLGDYESLKQASFDPYLALRDAYFENRRSLIKP